MMQDLVPSPGGTSVSAHFCVKRGPRALRLFNILAAGTAQTPEYRLSRLKRVKASLKLLHGLQIWLWASSPPEPRVLWKSRVLWWAAVWSRLPAARVSAGLPATGLPATGLPPAGLSAAARVSPARLSGKLWPSLELMLVMLDLTDAELTYIEMWMCMYVLAALSSAASL